MQPATAWDWSPGRRVVLDDVKKCSREYEWLEEYVASPDGESLAVPANFGEEGASMVVNGEPWENIYERVWYPRYSPDGRLTALAADMGEWTMCVDDTAWENTYGFLLNTRFSATGDVIAAPVQKDGEYGWVVDDAIWETTYEFANQFAMAADGSATAAVVQNVSFGQADIFTYKKGCYSVAVNGESWGTNFINCYSPAFDAAGKSVAATVRTSLYDYTIVVDGKPWAKTWPCAWEPVFNPATGDVCAAVRMAGRWGMALNGELIWNPTFFQVWQQQFSGDGKHLYAIVSPAYGKWTVAVDGQPWAPTFGSQVTDLVVSPDGAHAAALGADAGAYAVAVDGYVWPGTFAMAWAPVFSADSEHCAAKVERRGGKFTILVDGKPYKENFDQVWDPVFSPEGDKVLIRAIDNGKYCRIVVPVRDF
ncbi:MAG: WD40 repeat domain-containing protein [Desulfovibrionaceae bacterium]|jgi:hypothetical protein|nr:WD40 repeat domain-containing protein [Desulfovibrionaceae bacterium]